MTIRDRALTIAADHGAPFGPRSLWAELIREASAHIATLPDDASADHAADAVLTYLGTPREWEPPCDLRRNLCTGLAARIRRLA